MEKEERREEGGLQRNRMKTWALNGRKDGGRDSRHRARVPRLKIDQAPGAVRFFFSRKLFCGRGTPRGTWLTSSYGPDPLCGSSTAAMAFRIGGLPIFSPIKIPSRLPHDGLLARHSRFKLLPNSWIPTRRPARNTNRAKRISIRQTVCQLPFID